MPIYNAGEYLRPAVLSIINQSYLNWELIIIDDGSTDNSLEHIQDILDPRIKIINDGLNKGLAARLNEIIDLGRGVYFARMDQDDLSYPDRFSSQVKLLKSDPSIDLVGVRVLTFTSKNNPIGYLPFFCKHQEITSKPWLGIYLPHPTWMGKMSWFRERRYASPAPTLCEDQELLLRCYRDSKYATVDQVLFAYRLRDVVPLKKLLITRWALFKVQFNFFIKRMRFTDLLFSLLSLLLKVMRDIMGISYPPAILDNKTVTDFKMILELNSSRVR